MKATAICPGVIHISTETQHELSSMFMRIQEFYESTAGLQGRFFTVDECVEVTSSVDTQYTLQWEGFNIPGDVVDNFFNLFWHDLVKPQGTESESIRAHKIKELNLYNSIVECPGKSATGDTNGNYYIIGTYQQCYDFSYCLYHGLCHAFWHLHPKFKKDSQQLLQQLPALVRMTIKQWLIDSGYSNSVIDDETNAYLATTSMSQIRYNLLEAYDRENYNGESIPWDIICEIQANFYNFLDTRM